MNSVTFNLNSRWIWTSGLFSPSSPILAQALCLRDEGAKGILLEAVRVLEGEPLSVFPLCEHQFHHIGWWWGWKSWSLQVSCSSGLGEFSSHSWPTQSADWVHGRRRALPLGQLVAWGRGNWSESKHSKEQLAQSLSTRSTLLFRRLFTVTTHTVHQSYLHSLISVRYDLQASSWKVSPCFSECVPTFNDVEIRTASWIYPKSTRPRKIKHWSVRRRTKLKDAQKTLSNLSEKTMTCLIT